MIRYSKPIGKRPVCPFCGMPIDRPKELETKRPGEMPVGSCTCGAVYAFDVTGHNLGPAFSEALVFACNMDWDLAWNLIPEDDYFEKLVENYDIETHLIIPGGSFEGRKISGALYFIRLHQDIREVTGEGVQKKLNRATPIPSVTRKQSKLPAKKKYTKKDIEKLVKDYNLEPLLKIAEQDRRILRDIQRLLYSPDELTRLRAADALGKVSAIIVQRDPSPVTTVLQALFTSVEDTAASSWGAVSAIGEIIANSPDIFAGYIPTLYQFLSEETRRANAMSAIAGIAGTKPEYIQKSEFFFIPFLKDPDPHTRGYTAWLLGIIKASRAQDDLEQMKNDSEEVKIYKNGTISKTTVGQLALEALENISQQ